MSRTEQVVFISSTVEDLRPYREKARDAVLRAGFRPIMMEYWGPSGRPPLGECFARVAAADLLVVIVAYRYGWVPEHQPTMERKSVTWLECEKAFNDGKEVLAFPVEDKLAWPEEFKEKHRIMKAYEEGKLTTELQQAVKDDEARLAAFKAWLGKNCKWDPFSTMDELFGKITAALPERQAGSPPPPPDPTRYLQNLRDQTSHIEIRGPKVGSGQAMRFPIEQLYIPLTTTMGDESPKGRSRPRSEDIELDVALRNRLLVVVGDPGSGKSTFFRHVASRACRAQLGEGATSREKAAEEIGVRELAGDSMGNEVIGAEITPFPVLIRRRISGNTLRPPTIEASALRRSRHRLG